MKPAPRAGWGGRYQQSDRQMISHLADFRVPSKPLHLVRQFIDIRTTEREMPA